VNAEVLGAAASAFTLGARFERTAAWTGEP